jgi:hypothetical protein
VDWVCNPAEPTSGRALGHKPSHNMPFPHPQSCKHHNRKEDKPGCGRVVGEFFKRTVNISEYRNAEDDVNPSKNPTCSALVHDCLLHGFCFPSIHKFCAAGGGELGVSTPNCLAYSACNRCQPNFMASGPTMRPRGFPLRRPSRTSKQMCQPAAPMAM